MGLKPEHGSVMIIHGGGRFGDKQNTLKVFERNFKRLPSFVKKYISLENDEWNYSVDDLLPLCEKLNIPFCLDVFHNSISNESVILTDSLLKRIIATWKVARMKIHYSTQEPGERKGTHSKIITELPAFILQWPKHFGINLDIMLETKMKEVNTLEMYKKYFRATYTDHGRLFYVLK